VAYVATDWKYKLVALDGIEQGKYDNVGFLTFSPDSKRIAYGANTGREMISLRDDEYEEQKVSSPPGPSKVEFPNEKGVKRIKKAAGKWQVVVDGVPGKKYDMVANGTFSPDSKHFVYWAMSGETWRVVVDDVEGKDYDEPLLADNRNLAADRKPVFVQGLMMYFLEYPASRFVFSSEDTFWTLAQRDKKLVRLQVQISSDR
jgi:hypothetical protein